MPAWLLPLLLKYVLPTVVNLLQKLGFVNWAEKTAVNVGLAVVNEVEGIKTYGAPTDYPKIKQGR